MTCETCNQPNKDLIVLRPIPCACEVEDGET